jgi:3-methyladenine DNA glycosylase/8-oxoguanine DNA glycosylase
MADGTLPLDALAHGPATLAEPALRALRGVGPWTAQYVLLRGLGFADCLPAGDSAIAAAMQGVFGLDHRPDAREQGALAAPFAPHRSLLTWWLWRRFAADCRAGIRKTVRRAPALLQA